MTDDEKIALIALILGDIEGGPYYPMFTEAQYRQFLAAARGNVDRATVLAAISAGYMVAAEGSREQIGELSIASSTSNNYLKLLDYLIKTAGKVPPSGLMPWFAGQDCPDDNKLLNYKRCSEVYLTRFSSESGCC